MNNNNNSIMKYIVIRFITILILMLIFLHLFHFSNIKKERDKLREENHSLHSLCDKDCKCLKR
ncbi:hypothetical protein Goe21_02370 [Bacillus phage vB_BsuM-Goe21]|nr:hypothetical protein Goe21_02370 [Bacillus phage vB_BsuM-Goe21]